MLVGERMSEGWYVGEDVGEGSRVLVTLKYFYIKYGGFFLMLSCHQSKQ